MLIALPVCVCDRSNYYAAMTGVKHYLCCAMPHVPCLNINRNLWHRIVKIYSIISCTVQGHKWHHEMIWSMHILCKYKTQGDVGRHNVFNSQRGERLSSLSHRLPPLGQMGAYAASGVLDYNICLSIQRNAPRRPYRTNAYIQELCNTTPQSSCPSKKYW